MTLYHSPTFSSTTTTSPLAAVARILELVLASARIRRLEPVTNATPYLMPLEVAVEVPEEALFSVLLPELEEPAEAEDPFSALALGATPVDLPPLKNRGDLEEA